MRRIAEWLILAVAFAMPPLPTLGQAAPATTEPAAGEQSVKPGINAEYDNTKSETDVEKWVGRFEREGREVYAQRAAIVAAMGLRDGQVVADVGAGTGSYTELFSKAVGPAGKVYAEDIVPAFLEHIQAKANELGLDNVQTVLGTEKSIELPADSVDVVFVCDTYHHFEYPQEMLASIHRALRPGGQLVIVDFKRVEGESREWVMNHVRAGQDVVTNEVTSADFEFVEAIPVDGLTENYLLWFRKPR